MQSAGLVNYDGSGNFTGVTFPEDQALVGGPNNSILGIDPTGFDPGNPICSTGVGTPPAFSATPVCDSISINNLPVNPTDGANKQYVDLVAGSFSFLDSTVCSSTANLNATYNNGVAGVGATLTNAGTLAAIQLDGYSPLVTNRVLIKNQTNEEENGVYVVTVEGDNLTAWVLTRAADYDTPAEITPGSLVSVLYGNTLANTFWAETQTVTTIGTDPILFIQFSVVPSGVLLSANNLNDVASASASRTNLGLTNVATQNVTQYSVLTGDASDAINSLPVGSAGQVLTSQGPGAFPSWVTPGSGPGITSVNIQTFTSSGTYTPTTNMVYCIVELVGGGGGGGAANNPGFNNGGAGGGGGAGGYSRKLFDAATIGASQSVVIGAGGTPGAPGNNSTFGSFLTCNGGGAGVGGGQASPGAFGGSASGGDVNVTGTGGGSGFGILGASNFVGAQSGAGGGGPWGGGAPGCFSAGNSSNPGYNSTGYGGGGGGAAGSSNSAGGFASQPGGSGYQGVCIITEYIA